MAKVDANLVLARSNSAVHRRHGPTEGDDATVLIVLDAMILWLWTQQFRPWREIQDMVVVVTSIFPIILFAPAPLAPSLTAATDAGCQN